MLTAEPQCLGRLRARAARLAMQVRVKIIMGLIMIRTG
jgi:hypothetical protein